MKNYAKRARSAVVIACGLGASIASTGCNEFWDVVIPAKDVTAPTVVPGYILNGKKTIGVGGIYVETTDKNATFYAISSAVDTGGVARLESMSRVVLECAGNGRSQWVWPDEEIHDGHATQDGDVGDTVSSGLWDMNIVRLSALLRRATCPGDTWPITIRYLWRTYAWDFHGNVSPLTHGEITYRAL